VIAEVSAPSFIV